MASVDDVLTALKSAVITAITPLSFSNTILVGAGFPNMPALTKELEQGNSFVGITALPTEKLSTRFFPLSYVITPPAVGLTASVSGNTIAFGGTPGAGFNVQTTIDSGSQTSINALYQTTGSDTLASIATNTAAALTTAGAPSTASGDTVTVSGTIASLVCNVAGSATLGREVRRTCRHFQISTYTPPDSDPSLTALSTKRSAIVSAIDTALATTYFLQFPDTSWGRLEYVRGPWDDDMQRETMLIAHQIFSVDWGTIAIDTASQIGAIQVQQSAVSAASITTTLAFTEG